jgi:hypothetical protein
MGGAPVDFFISHAGTDRPWAEWVAWQLTQAGYSVELDVWDWGAGQNFITAMNDALGRCARVVALFSAAYFDRQRYTTGEWAASVVHVPGLAQHRLIPLRVENVVTEQVPPLLRPLIARDLFGLDEDRAHRALLEAVAEPQRPGCQPDFPGARAPVASAKLGDASPRLPGSQPAIWNVPPRNPAFTGRDGLLVAMRERLLNGDRAVVQALHGMGGVGKTQLAVEYSHLFAGSYDLVWWIAAEETGLIGGQFAALAAELGHTPAGTGNEEVRRAVLAGLRANGRWLLVFDNAENPRDLAGWLPGRGGHVLITSRAPGWTELAVPVEVDVLARSESVAILQGWVKGLTAVDAFRLSEALGDLPLGLAQAGAYLADTGMDAAEYQSLLETRAADILGHGQPVSYPQSLAAATSLSIDRLGSEDPAAMEVVSVCAFLGAELVPGDMFVSNAGRLPPSLARKVADALAWRDLLSRIGRYAIARVDRRGLQFHRLTQAIARDRLGPDERTVYRALAEKILAGSKPGDTDNPSTWSAWALLMPHLLAADFAVLTSPELRTMACDAMRYLRVRGSTRSSHDLADNLWQHWRSQFGDDDAHTLEAASNLAAALWQMGRCADAGELDVDTLDRRRRVLGEDHPDTLRSANALASDLYALGEVQAARDLFEDTLERRRRVLGDDHPDTLSSASNLAAELRALNDMPAARDLFRDTLERRRRVLGDDHPDTLRTASNLAIVVRELGESWEARDLDRDTLERRRRILGDDHPDTLNSASNLASELYELGEPKAARDLDRDTLERRRRILGADHPDTLNSASNLASDLRKLDEAREARDLDRDTLERRRRILGADHPDTQASARHLDIDKHALGERDDNPLCGVTKGWLTSWLTLDSRRLAIAGWSLAARQAVAVQYLPMSTQLFTCVLSYSVVTPPAFRRDGVNVLG